MTMNIADVNVITEHDFKTVEKCFFTLYSPALNTKEVDVAR